jgi:hypothetical protein
MIRISTYGVDFSHQGLGFTTRKIEIFVVSNNFCLLEEKDDEN